MRILIVSAHPNRRSLTQLIADYAIEALTEDGHQIKHFDLYAMKFNPVSSVYSLNHDPSKVVEPDLRAHVEAIQWADGFIFIYPIWSWERPAILKGWFDRLFYGGVKLNVQGRGHEAQLTDKRALVFQTCGDSLSVVEANGAQEVMHGSIVSGTLELCGIYVDHLETYYAVGKMEAEKLLFIHTQTRNICKKWQGRL